MMTTPVIMTVIWRTFFHESLGPVNDFFSLFGMTPLWLSSELLAKFTVVLVEVWQWTPFMFLLLLAGLLSLPKEPFLAASIGGAGPIRTFVYVTFPLMAPISIGAIIIRLIEASKIMDTVYVLTSGGPGTSSVVVLQSAVSPQTCVASLGPGKQPYVSRLVWYQDWRHGSRPDMGQNV